MSDELTPEEQAELLAAEQAEAAAHEAEAAAQAAEAKAAEEAALAAEAAAAAVEAEKQAAEAAAEAKKPRGKAAAAPADEPAIEEFPVEEPVARGPFTPVQFHDDGWNGLPVQMRG